MLRPQNTLKFLALCSFLALPAAIGLALPAQALSLYTGYDANPNATSTNSVVLPLASRTNSIAAYNAYKANLGGNGVTTESYETYETVPKGATPIDKLVQQLSGVTATYSYTKKSDGTSAGASETVAVQKADAAGLTNAGTFPTDGVQGISINSANNFKIKFASPLAAFSFWGTDLGDRSNTLTVILRKAGVDVQSKLIDYLDANAGNSSVFFFGGIAQNAAEQFDEVELLSSISSTGDAIGIDQLTVGTAAQLTPQSSNAVPTPALLPGLIALAAGARRRLKAAQ
jgi:hypothetical protein